MSRGEVATVPAATALGALLPGFAGAKVPEWLTDKLRRGLAGVCLFADNIESPPQLRELVETIRRANPRAIIAIDEEGGDVTRLHGSAGSPHPGNAILGRIDDAHYTFTTAAMIGSELRALGINLNFGPVADINSNSDNPVIGTRSFGNDTELVSRHTDAWIRGLQSTGVAACAKHFPGHGDTAADSHLALPVIDVSIDVLRAREFAPFRTAIEAGVKAIMSSHILVNALDPTSPASLSHTVMTEILRDEMGFAGVVVSDALDMAGASDTLGMPAASIAALNAGCDLLCLGRATTRDQLEDVADAIENGIHDEHLSPGRLRSATTRVSKLALELSASTRSGIKEAPLRSRVIDTTRAAGYLQTGTRQPPRLPFQVVQLETDGREVIETSSWGLAQIGLPVLHLFEGERLPLLENIVLVGRDNHRHAWVRRLIDDARGKGCPVLVVDMGWPSADRAYADVSTFGASPFASEVLAAWLTGQSQATRPSLSRRFGRW